MSSGITTCGVCVFWETPFGRDGGGNDKGFCHRNAPFGRDGFPMTKRSDWCGEMFSPGIGSPQFHARYTR